MKTTSNPRIKDIATMAGVSIGTVDRVLHQRGEVAEETRVKIMKIADELNYSPNLVARALKTKKNLSVVALLPTASEENVFWYKHQVGMEKALVEMSPFPVVITQANFDALNEADFKTTAEKVVAQKPDGVLIAPIFKQETFAMCEALGRLKIPYVFVDSYLSDVDFLAFIGEDAYQSGRVAAHLIDYGTPHDKDILIVNIARDLENTLHLNSRMQGFLSYFMDAGNNTGLKISLEIHRPDFNEVTAKLDQVVKSNPNIGAVFVTSSKVYKIARYFEENQIRHINLIGYDMVERNVRHLRTGQIKFLLSQRPVEQVEKGLKKLYEFLSVNRVPVKMEYLPIDVITPENINFFI
jgi:LacI family transcriptional regulator